MSHAGDRRGSLLLAQSSFTSEAKAMEAFSCADSSGDGTIDQEVSTTFSTPQLTRDLPAAEAGGATEPFLTLAGVLAGTEHSAV